MSTNDYSQLGFSNKFMFGKLMENDERCKRLLEQILGFKIHHIEKLEREKTIDEKYDGHGIRLDIYVEDGKTVYNCEMQNTNEHNLPKRSRYYQSQIDSSSLQKGVPYRQLTKSFVIFICTFDPFSRGQYVYTFENRCMEVPDLNLGDETTKIFVNTKGNCGNTSEEFKELLRFIDTSEDRPYENDLANDLLSDLKKARNNEDWRHDYMTWRDYGNDCHEEGLAEGLEKGRAEGLKKGREVEKVELIENMLRKGKAPIEIADFCGLELDLIEQVQESILSKSR